MLRSLPASIICGLMTLSGPSLAQELVPLKKEVQQQFVDWLKTCDLNKKLDSVTCKEIEKCLNKPLEKDEHPLVYELMRDPNQNGVVCEHLTTGSTASTKRSHVVYGLGLATGLEDQRLGSTELVDAEGDPLVAEFRGGETRPVITASYLFPMKNSEERRFWPGIMAVVSADIASEGSLVKPTGIGAGFTSAFRGGQGGDNWTQAFGIGIAYMWESAKLPSAGPDPVLIDKTVGSVLLVVTYSFGKKWPQL